MKKPVFMGSNVAICTPFSQDGSVNYPELGRLIEWHIENGTNSITICGTTGETCTLSDDEHKKAIKFTVDTVNKRIPVVAGTGSNDTAYAISLSKYADEVGADALLCVTPYYNKTSQRGLVAHFEAIADSVSIPVILYHVPSRTGVTVDAETYKHLAKHKNIIGVKEASGDFSLLAKTRAICPEDFYIWSGNDDQIVAMMSIGAIGVISVMANILPKETRQLTDLCLEGKFKEATDFQSKYINVIENLFTEVNPIPVKSALKLIGFDMGELRLPLYKLSDENEKNLAFSMKQVGLSI